jgi:hypothetical protein
MSETITVTSLGTLTGGFDEGGYPLAGNDVTVDLIIAAFAPRGSDESVAGAGQTVITGGTIYGLPGTVLLSTDRLTIRGEVWQVEGESGVWASPYSSETMGVEIAVKRAS